MNLATGSFDSVRTAEDTINALKDKGFGYDHVSVVVRDREKGNMLARDLNRTFKPDDNPEDAIITKDIYGRLSDPYIDTYRKADIPEESVDWYRSELDSGHVLVVVNVEDRMEDADRIILDHGGTLYRTRDQRGAMRPGMMGRETKIETARPTVGETRPEMMEREMRTARTTGGVSEVRMPIIEEEVVVEKEQQNVGEVQVHAEKTQETVDVPVTLVHNRIRVERRKLDHPIKPEEYKYGQTEEGVLRMPVVDEEIHVYKRPVIREELIITRMPVTEQRIIHETITHTEPHLETTGDVEMQRGEMTEEERKRRPAA